MARLNNLFGRANFFDTMKAPTFLRPNNPPSRPNRKTQVTFNMTRSATYSVKLKVIAICAALLVGIFSLVQSSFLNFSTTAASSGPPTSHTDAPGEANCTSCHENFELNSGGGQLLISGLPKNYLPNQQIPVTVTLNHNGGIRYGFQMTAIDKNGLMTGSYVLPAASPQPLQVVNGFVNGNQRSYIEHTLDGVTPTEFNTKSWNFTFTAPPTRGGKIRFFAAGNGGNSDGSSDGDYIYTTSNAILSGSAISNYDGDFKSNLAVFRPSNATWYALTNTGATREFQWGLSTDVIVPGDYDGDGNTDDAVWRPSDATWRIHTFSGVSSSTQFGQTGDVPVAADYDGDLKTDIAVFRPSSGTWRILRSSDLNTISIPFGANGDKPAPADHDGDAKADLAFYRPLASTWHLVRSTDGATIVTGIGQVGDEAVPGDYDGDGQHDLAVYRPSSSTWYIQTATQSYSTQLGSIGDRPAPADFDGDGATDVAVFRDGSWTYIASESGTTTNPTFGLPGDVAVPRGYIPGANVAISGRVVDAAGRGIAKAYVALNGGGYSYVASTNSFGYYSFPAVSSGVEFTMVPSSKRYTFTPRVVTPLLNMTSFNFTGN